MEEYNINDLPDRFTRHMKIVTEWLQEVYTKYSTKLSKQNLKCIGNIIKQYIQDNKGILVMDNLQLYGCVAAHIVKPPSFKVDRWTRVSDNKFTEDEFNSLISPFEKLYFNVCDNTQILTTNRRCTKINSFEKKHAVLHSCSIFPDIKLIKVLGEGSFGIVYLGEATYEGGSKKHQVAVKFIKEDLSDDDFEDLNLEISFSYNMGVLGLGPKIYDAFYIIDDNDKYKQVIIMDYYKHDGTDAFKVANKKQATEIIVQMIKLLKYMIFTNKMYCVDIKPANFIVNEKLDDVKLIDFGSDWCTPQKLMTDSEEQLFQILIFQLYSLISKIYIALNDDELGEVFCRYFSDQLLPALEKYYNNDKNLTVKHYIQKSKHEVIQSANKLKSSCRVSPRKRTSPSPNRSPNSPRKNRSPNSPRKRSPRKSRSPNSPR